MDTEKQKSSSIKILAFVFGLAAFALASLYANGLMVPAQSKVLVVLAISAVLAVIAASLGSEATNPLPVLLFLLVANYFFARAICSPVRDLANEDLVLISVAVLTFFIFAGLRGGGRWLLIGLIILALIHVVAGCMQKLELIPAHNTGRAKGLFWHYNYFANFAGAGLLVCLAVLLWGKVHMTARLCLVAVSVMTLAAVYWSGSRGAVLALGVSGFAFLVLSYLSLPALTEALRRRYRGILMLALCAGIAGGGVLVYQVFSQKAEGATGGDIFFASTLRLYFLPMAIEQFQEAPVFGTGSRTFSYLCFQHWNPNIALDRPNPEFVHNDHIQTLAEYGLVGYLLVLSFVVYSLVRGVMLIRWLGSDPDSEGASPLLPIAGICIVLFACVHAMVDFNLHLVPNLMVAVAGLAMIHSVQVKKRHHSIEGKKHRLWLYGIILMITPAMVHAYAFGMGELAAGRVLAQSGISKETSNWIPAEGELDANIASLEEAVETSPTFRRYAHLGLCYQIAARKLEHPEEREAMLRKAIASYRASVERNPMNPVAKLNLAKTLGDVRAWEESDNAFREAMVIARVREPWLLGQLGWATMHSKWALSDWQGGDLESAERRFLHAIELAGVSKSMYPAHRDPKWLAGYTKINIYYARLLITGNRLDDAEQIYTKLHTLAKRDQTELETRLVQNYAAFLYRKAIHLWRQRELDQAAALLIKSEKEYLRHQRLVEGEVDLEWDLGYKELQKTIAFFKKTGLMRQ